jgi:hypothetical protein
MSATACAALVLLYKRLYGGPVQAASMQKKRRSQQAKHLSVDDTSARIGDNHPAKGKHHHEDGEERFYGRRW